MCCIWQFDWDADFNNQTQVIQSALTHARNIHNDIHFLALCGDGVNKKKQGAFQRSLNKLIDGKTLEHDLQHELFFNFSNPKLVNPFGTEDAKTMALAVADRLRDIEEPLTAAMRDVNQGLAQGKDNQLRYDQIADEIIQLYDHFGLTRRV